MIFAEIGPVEQFAPKRGRAEEMLPEGERVVEARDAHADMVNRRWRS